MSVRTNSAAKSYVTEARLICHEILRVSKLQESNTVKGTPLPFFLRAVAEGSGGMTKNIKPLEFIEGPHQWLDRSAFSSSVFRCGDAGERVGMTSCEAYPPM